MPDPSTSRLALYKSKSDGSELVNYTQDIGQNLDKLDLAVGYQACTSTTRPSSPYSGKPIMESDTSYRTYFSNGTSPASASWVEIPNSSATFNSNLKIASGKQINFGASGSNAYLAVLTAASGDDVISTRVTGDTASRFLLETDGAHSWGPGGSTPTDVTLTRSGTSTLTLTGSLSVSSGVSVTGGLTVGATTWTTYTPTVTNGGSVTWTTRTGYYYKLGKIVFVVVYLVVNVAGTGSGLVAVDMPSSVDRTTRQALVLHGETIGVNGTGSGTLRGGEAVFFPGGSGATSDRLRVVDADGDGSGNVQGVDLKAGASLTIQGWYREA